MWLHADTSASVAPPPAVLQISEQTEVERYFSVGPSAGLFPRYHRHYWLGLRADQASKR
jgi:hypothetical protein